MIKKFKIGNIDFEKKNKPIFIAEAAVEHLGSLNVAKQMAVTAKKCGADIIKYQMHIPNSEMLKNKIKFWGGSLDQILDNYNLSIDDHKELIKFCISISASLSLLISNKLSVTVCPDCNILCDVSVASP